MKTCRITVRSHSRKHTQTPQAPSLFAPTIRRRVKHVLCGGRVAFITSPRDERACMQTTRRAEPIGPRGCARTRIHRIRTEYSILRDTRRIRQQDTSGYIRIQSDRPPPISDRTPPDRGPCRGPLTSAEATSRGGRMPDARGHCAGHARWRRRGQWDVALTLPRETYSVLV